MKIGTKPLASACKPLEEDLVLYYYGDCSEAERVRIEKHLEACVLCRDFLEDLRGFLPEISGPKEFPPAFWDRYFGELREKLAIQQERGSRWSLLAPIRFWLIPAVGTIAVVVLGLAMVLNRGGMTGQRQPALDNVPQEIVADASKLDFFRSMDLLESLQTLEALDRKSSAPKTVHSL